MAPFPQLARAVLSRGALKARFVRITQLGAGSDPWAIHELQLIQPGSMFPLANR